MARLGVVKYFNEHGGLPVNLKFFVEGEEETGSRHVPLYVNAHQDELKADACIWEGGGKNSVDHFEVVAGVRGIVRGLRFSPRSSHGENHREEFL